MQFRIDYLSLTVWGMSASDACHEVATWIFNVGVFEEDPEKYFELLDNGARGFACVHLAPSAAIYSEPRTKTQAGDYVHIELKGGALENVEFKDLMRFVNNLHDGYSRVQCTRIDTKWIDAPVSPRQVYDAAKAGNIRVACRRVPGWLRWFSSDVGTELPEQNPGSLGAGESCYVGQRKSPRHLCVYNGRGRNDFEFRSKDERATLLLDDLRKLSSLERASDRAMAYVLDFVSFVDVSERTNVSEAPPLEWWAFFLDGVKRAGVKIVKKAGDFVRGAREQLKRAARVVALWKRATKSEWVDEQLAAAEWQLGERRLVRARHLQLAWNEAHSVLDEPEISKPLFPGLICA